MKRFNYFVMSLISAAAFTFTACSSSDDLNGGGSGESKVDGFYMTLTVQTPTSTGTRTVQKNPKEASAAESDVTSGTFYLVDASGNIVFQKSISTTEWQASKIPTQGQIGKTQLVIPVTNVGVNTAYKVYFLANTTDAEPWSNTFEAETKFANPYATANAFAMFNQNDNTTKGDGYTVTFTSDNKSTDNAAQVSGTIKLDRITARIDAPTSGTSEIKPYEATEGKELNEKELKAMKDAVTKVESLELTAYAISNVATKTNIMQKWDAKGALLIPTDTKYWQPTAEFGTKTFLDNYDYFNKDLSHQDYVFENNSTTSATTMYFEYKIKLNADKFEGEADAKDGTFYRYNGVIYNSIAAVIKAHKDLPGFFGGKAAADIVKELKIDEDGNVTASETDLDQFRKDYSIEVFKEGKAYYKKEIVDQYINAAGTIQRNSIYQLTVNNIFNVGADVPNGGPEYDEVFYLDVEVSVNPWVLNTQGVDLQ